MSAAPRFSIGLLVGVLLGPIVGGTGTACSLDKGGAGSGTLGLESASSSGTTAPPAESTGPAPIDTTTTHGGGSTFGPLDTSSGSETTATPPTTTGDPTGDSSSGGGPPPLIDTGLLARWYIDEADTGQPAIDLLDSAPLPVDLTLLYQGDSPAYAEVAGNRALRWTLVGEDGRAYVPIAGTKIESPLGGSQQATIELVLSVDAVSGSMSRFLHIGTDSANGDLSIGSRDMTSIEVRWGGATVQYFTGTLDGSKQVLHLVIDTTLPLVDDRLRVYLDGVELPTEMAATVPTQGAGIPLVPTSWLTLGNRSDGMRSFVGRLHYAAIYTASFGPGGIANNAAVLAIHDDTP